MVNVGPGKILASWILSKCYQPKELFRYHSDFVISPTKEDALQ